MNLYYSIIYVYFLKIYPYSTYLYSDDHFMEKYLLILLKGITSIQTLWLASRTDVCEIYPHTHSTITWKASCRWFLKFSFAKFFCHPWICYIFVRLIYENFELSSNFIKCNIVCLHAFLFFGAWKYLKIFSLYFGSRFQGVMKKIWLNIGKVSCKYG